VLWVVTSGGLVQERFPFGEVIRMAELDSPIAAQTNIR
jgi:hypothetical protein